jgi:hypothetical protein
MYIRIVRHIVYSHDFMLTPGCLSTTNPESHSLHVPHLQLTHEVTRGVYLKDEVRRLEAQNVEDRMRIQRLLALSQPVQHDITFTARPVDFGRGGASHLEPWEEDVEDWVQKMLGTEKDPKVIEQLKAIKELYEVRHAMLWYTAHCM